VIHNQKGYKPEMPKFCMKNPDVDNNLLKLMRSLQTDVNALRSMDPLASLSKYADACAARRDAAAQASNPAATTPKPDNGGSVKHVTPDIMKGCNDYQRLTNYITFVAEQGSMADVGRAIKEVRKRQYSRSSFISGCYTHMLYALDARRQKLLDNECSWIMNGSTLEAHLDKNMINSNEYSGYSQITVIRMGQNKVCA